ncbi:MAG: NACHT domain-containing protein [Limnoraphis sp. WC205]|nr:NACHT domain-containing protein [Limnoraphis sp. WC205]
MSIVNNVATIRVIATPGTAMASNPQQFEEEFSEAYEQFEIERLLSDLTQATHIQEKKKKKDFSPAAKAGLLGRLCGFSRDKIARKSGFQLSTIRHNLSNYIYPALTEILNLEENIDWQEQNVVAELLHEYRKKPRNSSAASPDLQIDWRKVCAKMLEKQQQNQQIRRKATQMGFETQVYVPLGLVERKQQQNLREEIPIKPMNFRENEVIERIYERDEFLSEVIGKNQNKRLAIVGESGSGKTTWVDQIATYIKDKTEDLYICISLGSLQKKTLEEYILEKWLPKAIAYADLDIDSETLEKPLQKRLRRGGVWLLLDGVDEIGETSISQKLENIQDQLTGWLSEARIILTCRTNVWDTYLKNPLSGFDTYKTQEFTPEQVDQYIQGWFTKAKQEQRGQALQDKLKEPQHEHVSQLVKNPLRLALLCQIFSRNQNAELPETKAGLYKQFIGYFYEWKPAKIGIDLVNQPTQQHELHQALGRLAIAGLDSSARFRLPQSLVKEDIINDELFNLALNLDWLVLIDRDNKTDEPIYQFFHPSFQEYFAALVIDDWDFFVPRDHVDQPVPGKRYCIFEAEYKQVFIFWLGRNDINQKSKDMLLKTLINFEDSCLNIYRDRAYFLAASAINEVKEFEECEEIIKTVINLSLQYNSRVNNSNYPSPVFRLAYQSILQINSTQVADSLVNIINKSQDELIWCQAATLLGEIKVKNSNTINALIYVINQSQYEYPQCMAASSLGKIDSTQSIAKNTLTKLIENSNQEYVYATASVELLKIDPDNLLAINVLIELIFDGNFIGKKIDIVEVLWKSNKGKNLFINQIIFFIKNREVKNFYPCNFIIENYLKYNSFFISELTKLISKCDDFEVCRIAAEILCKVAPLNSTAIQTLLKLIQNSEDDYTQVKIARTLIEIDETSTVAIDILFDILNSSNEEFIQGVAAWGLRKVKSDNRKRPIIVNAIKNLLKNSQDELSCVLAAGSLAILDKGNSKALKILAKSIKKSTDETDTLQAIYCLREVEKVNLKVMEALSNAIKTTENNTIVTLAVNQLCYLINFLPENIEFIITLIREQSSYFYENLAKSLWNIKSLDYRLIEALLDVIKSSEDKTIVDEITVGVCFFIKNDNKIQFLEIFKKYYLEQEDIDIFWRFDAYYQLLWYCSQHMTYPEFYHAWNSPALITSSETPKNLPAGNTSTVQVLEEQIRDLGELLKELQPTQKTFPIVINAEPLEDETDNTAIAQELCNQIYKTVFPDDENIPEVNNHPQLKRLIPRLKKHLNTQHIALILYQCEPNSDLISFCRKLTNDLHVAFITTQKIEPPLAGFPDQPHLVSILQNWLSEREN